MKPAILLLLAAGAALNAQDSRPTPRPVRNDVAQPGREIVTIRYFRIKKGTFDVFLKTSQEDIWPFFDKMGARVVGMWKVFDADENPGPTNGPFYMPALKESYQLKP